MSYFMRQDGEAKSKNAEIDTIDISTLFEFGVWPNNAEKSALCLMQAIRQSRKVVTDRLHVGIACSLLDHECDLFDNNYGKNSTIFYHSIRKKSQQVKLCK
ncbi:hypothetical protein BB934_15880 [Microvirga ossetica]|uniref:Polysaccharide pyruvyl transferase domain-containing protein n=2 Tax=Microvirga ossetica TaxID=1882682 RepID=A0A1B2EHQ5_9HYPH|nr:hypothetical protein BB934_15880 [Microvirga ossetica]